MATYGHTFTSGDTLTPPKLNDARTVTDIVDADIGKLNEMLAAIEVAAPKEIADEAVGQGV
jgi:hypothetical protein